MNARRNMFAAVTAAFAACLGTLSAQADAPTPPDTQWKVTKKTSYVYLTETGIPDGQTPWKFILTSGGLLSVATKVDSTSSTKINLRTIPSDCPYQIKTAGRYNATGSYGYFMNNGIGGTASQAYSKAAGSIIEEIYLPDSLTKLDQYAFANCTNLVVCDFTENSELATISQQSFCKCNKLRKLRFTERLTTLTTSNANYGPITDCAQLQIEGPTLPDSVTTLKGQVFRNCPNAFFGRLTIGGSDTNDISYLTSYGQYLFGGCTGITEVVFGAGVTSLIATSAGVFQNCTAITNIVCRNPNGFFFNSLHSTMSNVKQYDFYGWPTGTLVTKNTGTRILAPRDNATWLGLVAGGDGAFTPWEKLTDAQKETYWTNFPSNDAENALIPEGRIAGTKGSKTYEGCTIPFGTWVVFDKGKVIEEKSLNVKGEVGDLDPAEGEPVFSPEYGYTHSVVQSFGEVFDCTAPRYVANSQAIYEISGYTLCSADTNGEFTVVAKEGAFAGEEARRWTFDTAVLTNSAYELTWRMTAAGYAAPTVVAPSISGLGTWTVNEEPDFKGYYSTGTVVTVTAAGADGHDFVMWGVKEDMWNPTRYDATLHLAMNRNWTVYPTFKTDSWKFNRTGKAIGTITDGAWTFYVNGFDTTNRAVKIYGYPTVSGYQPRLGYCEEIDWAKPVYFTGGTGADTNEVFLTTVGQLRSTMPQTVNMRLRKVSFGKDVKSVGVFTFYCGGKGCVSNLTDIVFESAPTIGGGSFDDARALRRIVFNAGVPKTTESEGFAWLKNHTPSAVTVTVQRDNEEWQAFAKDTAKVTPWSQCTQKQKDAFYKYHPDEPAPFGLIKATQPDLEGMWLVIAGKHGTVFSVQ